MVCERTEQTGWDSQTAPDLSVVVVTYNEADRIELCLDAVLEHTRQFDDVEVVLVDSRSTDETVALASAYPIRVYRIPPSVDRTPGGGRFVGTQVTHGDHLLFVDGDMAIEGEWLDAAVSALVAHDDIAGVDGHLTERHADEPRDVAALRGVVLYERAALARAGGFDPFLHALEDIELGFRFADTDDRLVRLPEVAATHTRGGGVTELRRRWRRGYFFGRGQVLRKWWRSPRMVQRLVGYSRLYAAIGGWLTIGVVAPLIGGPIGGLAWLCVTALLLAVAYRVRGPNWLHTKAITAPAVFAGGLVGFLTRHPDPADYPVENAELVSPADHRPTPSPGGAR